MSALQSGQVNLGCVQLQFRQNIINFPKSVLVQFQNEIVAHVADRAMSVILIPVDIVMIWRLPQQPVQELSKTWDHPQSAGRYEMKTII